MNIKIIKISIQFIINVQKIKIFTIKNQQKRNKETRFPKQKPLSDG